jgi:4-amino-4-deoxy-L-arabinose transferase-like glycosyltransferase
MTFQFRQYYVFSVTYPQMTKLVNSNAMWWILALLTFFVYFYGLGIPLVGPDEPRYAQVAREMFERGDWITPTLGGFDWFEKPALLYWLQIVAYKLFGVTEFAARVGSSLFGLGTSASLWTLGRYSNTSTHKNESFELANWLALIAASTLGILVFSRAASFDVIVTFPLTASLVGFFISDRAGTSERKKEYLGLLAFYSFAGLAVLAKGLVGIVFPFGIVGIYFVLSWRLPPKRFLFSLIWGIVLVVAVAGVWNLPMYSRHGWKFVDEFYIQHHFQRYTSNKYQHPQPFYFYLWVLPLMTLPWLPFLVGGVWRTIKTYFGYAASHTGSGNNDSIRSPLLHFAIAWIVVPLAFFSLSGSKLPGYILPAVPGTIILAALSVLTFIRSSYARRTFVMGIAAGMLLTIAILIAFVVPKYADNQSVKRLVETADEDGYKESKVASFRTLSHNAEFYAAGRLIRDSSGKQKRFETAGELNSVTQENGGPLLILVPLRQLDLLRSSDGDSLRVITDNGDLAIVAWTTDQPPASDARFIRSINAAAIPSPFASSQ